MRTTQVRRHCIGRVAVEVVAGAVVGARRAGVGMPHGILDVLQRNAGAEEFGGEAVAKAVGADLVGRRDAGPAGEAG